MRKVRTLLPPVAALALLALLLSGCGLFSRPPAGDASLNLSTIEMRGIIRKNVKITANGAWTLKTGATWLSANPSSGVGDATVELTVDPSNLEPDEYLTSVTLTPQDHPSRQSTVVFAFPRLKGSVVLGDGGTASSPSLLSTQSVPSRPGRLLVGLGGGSQVAGTQGSDFAPLSATEFRTLAAGVTGKINGIRLLNTHPRSRVAVVSAQDMRSAAATLRQDPTVRYVEEDAVLERLATTDPERTKQWSLDVMNVENAWPDGNGTGVSVAVIDSGFDDTHPDLVNKVSQVYDAVTGNSYLPAPNGNCIPHGEHVAGIVGAETDNLEGIAGIAREAGLVLVNIGDSSSVDCPIRVSSVVEAFEWINPLLDAPRVDIVNMSFGGGHSAAMQDAVEAAYAEGITMVAAAGNAATSQVLYPAAYPQVLAVSATNRNDQIASYSTTGPQVFVSAPGGETSDGIVSTYYTYNETTGANDHGYESLVGTSMASPAVAGIAALIKSANPAFTPVDIAGILAGKSKDLGATGHDDTFGYGRVDADLALAYATDPSVEAHGFVLRGGTWQHPIPAAHAFVSGFVDTGSTTIEIGSDDDWDGNLKGETGEWYGEYVVDIPFSGEFVDLGTLSVELQ